jgi:putative ABC transport system permease protein
MRWLRRWALRVLNLFSERRRDLDFDDELEAHLQMHVDENMARGMSLDEAQRAARIKLGGAAGVREAHRDGRRFRPLTELGQDLRYAGRVFRRAPAFTLIAVVTIALGIFGPTVTFTMIKAWILEPLPFDEPANLVYVRRLDRPSGQPGSLNAADFLDWQRTARTFEGLAGYRQSNVRMTGGDRAERLSGAQVTAEFFQVLRVGASLGRVFLPTDRGPEAARLVVVSHAMWREYFRGDPAAIGRTIRINGDDHTVIGVLPETFQFTLLGAVQVWRPLVFTADQAANRRSGSIYGLGRIRQDRTVEDARSELTTFASDLATAYPDTNAKRGVRVIRLAEEVRYQHDLGFIVPVIFAMVSCVLLVACVNVTNVMLARASTRRQEMAVRLALGASRARIVRQWLVEHVLLFVCASACGAALAVFGANWITQSIPVDNRQYLRNYAALPVDRTVILFALATGALCGVIFGWLPGWTGARTDVNADLRESSARGTPGARGGRLRAVLVVSEVALALGVLITAGLLTRTARNISGVDPGFDPDNLAVFQMTLDTRQYRTLAETQSFFERLTSDLVRQPGVTAAAAGSLVPFGRNGNDAEFFLEGQSEPAPSETPSVALNQITPAYPATVRLRLTRGRLLSASDSTNAPKVALVSETAVSRHFLNQDPLGRRIRLARGSQDVWTIVGVVGDVKNYETIDPPESQVYVPFAQLPRRAMTVVLRTSRSPQAIFPSIRAAVAALDPAEPVSDITTMVDRIQRVTAGYQTIGRFVAFLGGLTLLLAGIGVYGVVSYTFAQRTKEIGIRIALGARRLDVATLVLRQLRALLLAALVPGLLIAWALGHALKAVLFGVTPTDWRLYLSMTLILAAVAILAAFVPARRATAIDPVTALRHE